MTDKPATTDLRMCVTCGKMGGTCRWVDDPVHCMREQLYELRDEVDQLRIELEGAAHNRQFDQRDAYFEGCEDAK